MKTAIKTLVVFVFIMFTTAYITKAIMASGFDLNVTIGYSYNKPIVHVEYEYVEKEVLDF